MNEYHDGVLCGVLEIHHNIANYFNTARFVLRIKCLWGSRIGRPAMVRGEALSTDNSREVVVVLFIRSRQHGNSLFVRVSRCPSVPLKLW
jgi:hypothetical protein